METNRYLEIRRAVSEEVRLTKLSGAERGETTSDQAERIVDKHIEALTTYATRPLNDFLAGWLAAGMPNPEDNGLTAQRDWTADYEEQKRHGGTKPNNPRSLALMLAEWLLIGIVREAQEQ